MAEYVKREQVRDMLHSEIDSWGSQIDEINALLLANDRLYEIPAADVAPVVHGRWVQVICHVEFEDGFVDRLYECCSRCHNPNGRKMTDYCPNCGAKMDAEVRKTD